jgi:signal transduction histidine kinase
MEPAEQGQPLRGTGALLAGREAAEAVLQPARSFWRRWTLRRKLVAGILLCLLPLALVLVQNIDQRYTARRALELRANRELAEAAGAVFEAYIRDLDHQLAAIGFVLGWRFDLDNHPVVQAYLTLNRVPQPTLALLALTDWDGQVIAADPPTALGVALGAEPYVRAAQAMDTTVVSDLLPAPDGGPPWFALARRVSRPDGTLVGVLVAYVDTSRLGEALALGRPAPTRFALLDRQGRVVYQAEQRDLPWDRRDISGLAHVQRALQGEPATSEQFVSPLSGEPSLGAAVPVPQLGWVAAAERPLAEAMAPIAEATRQEIAVFLLVVLLALLLAVALAYTLTRPLRLLQAATLEVQRGNYSRRVSVRGSDEVADLAASFNAMAARLEALEQERQAFAAMVAHDLRSPLTAVRGRAQLLQRQAGDDPALQRGLAQIIRETDRVARLARDLSDMTLAAAGRLELRPRTVDVVELVREALERLQGAGISQPLRLYGAPGPLWVEADPERLAQVLDNLLGNAVKYSPPDQPITVEVHAADTVRIAIRDRGPGIAPEDRAHLFERFYRSYRARHEGTGGVGLGLYISREIVAAHGGQLEVESAVGQGSCFTVVLPRAPGPPGTAPPLSAIAGANREPA